MSPERRDPPRTRRALEQLIRNLAREEGEADIGTNERAHDLVDLQLLDEDPGIDTAATAPIARRLFVARQSHPWPNELVSRIDAA